MNRHSLLIILLTLLSMAGMAQQKRPVTSRYSLEIGGGSVLDTYLSPIKYSGVSLSLAGEWDKHVAWADSTMVMQFNGAISSVLAQNPTKNKNLYEADLNFEWGLRKEWRPIRNLTLRGGAGVGFNAGVIYKPSNNNNPATAKADVNLSLGAMARYDTHIGRLPITISDEVRLPSLSLFFSQQYAETYYEIYLGNHSGLVHAGWWGNNFCIDNLCVVDMKLSKYSLSVGYRLRVRSSYVCDINTQIVTHAAVVGLTF
jgi:hypothetical protein